MSTARRAAICAGTVLWASLLVPPTSGAQVLPLQGNEPPVIAYTNGHEIRLIAPDGSNDHVIWTEPEVEGSNYSISSLSWRPDGTEIAFASDHEMATSLYGRDAYAVRPDGGGLRKLTNPPVYDELASFPKGSITVTVTNLTSDPGPYFVYVAGAAEPQQVTLSSNSPVKLTFDNVADFGDGVFQHAVVINGLFRWWDAAVAADVTPGSTDDAGSINVTQFGGIEGYGAESPFWRSDGSQVGFFENPTCILLQVPSDPAPGSAPEPLVGLDIYDSPCAADWAPLPSLSGQLLVTDNTDILDGEVHIYRTSEAAQTCGDFITTFDGYVSIFDLRWAPDGSGFLVAKHDDLLDRSVNIYEYSFANGELSQVTDLPDTQEIRSFSISPDGQFIVFAQAESEDDSSTDLWIMRRDGSEKGLLVHGGSAPSWGPASVDVGSEETDDVLPSKDALQVYPQPSRSAATVRFQLQQAQSITISLYDLLGRAVLVHRLGANTAGKHDIPLDLTNFGSGVYIVSITGSRGERQSAPIVVLK